MSARLARTSGRVAQMVGLALLMTACAELTGPFGSDPGSMIPSSIAKYLSSEPVASGTAAPPSAIPPPGAVRYRRVLMQAWQYHFGLAEDPAIGFGQVHQESRFDCAAVSPGGSAGCAQFMPATAEWINTLIPPAVRATCPSRSGCPMDPRWALTALVEYDWRLWGAHKWAVNNRERWAFSLAAYNGGGAVSTGERAACGKSLGCSAARYFDHVERFCGATGRSAASCRENRQYPRIILDHWTPLYRGWLGS
jgi:hypothetical protein